MIKVHHLSNSHSHVVLWLLEELGLDYEIVRHQRDPSTRRSPQSLRDVHPAAKAPTIEDRGCTMIESTGVILYILETYGDGRLRPPPGTSAAMSFYQWLTYMEGSAKAPLMMVGWARRLGGGAQTAMVEENLKVPLALIDDALAGREFIAGDAFTAADIQLCFLEELAEGMDRIAPYANMRAHLERMRARDGYRRAESKGGPVGLKAMFAALR
ncbi:glutathione S-transferase family protein [Phenylobacterium sp.]|jgi:glutathione S-transferase|uniref:glutathione S-transferase family protein n=1 Tax=Phenylobacterium sp. TaxID=1871053 RepID=UPI002F408968